MRIIKLVIAWILGLIFLISSIQYLIAGYIIAGIICLLMAILLIPPILKLIKKFLPFNFSTKFVVVTVISLYIILNIHFYTSMNTQLKEHKDKNYFSSNKIPILTEIEANINEQNYVLASDTLMKYLAITNDSDLIKLKVKLDDRFKASTAQIAAESETYSEKLKENIPISKHTELIEYHYLKGNFNLARKFLEKDDFIKKNQDNKFSQINEEISFLTSKVSFIRQIFAQFSKNKSNQVKYRQFLIKYPNSRIWPLIFKKELNYYNWSNTSNSIWSVYDWIIERTNSKAKLPSIEAAEELKQRYLSNPKTYNQELSRLYDFYVHDFLKNNPAYRDSFDLYICNQFRNVEPKYSENAIRAFYNHFYVNSIVDNRTVNKFLNPNAQGIYAEWLKSKKTPNNYVFASHPSKLAYFATRKEKVVTIESQKYGSSSIAYRQQQVWEIKIIDAHTGKIVATTDLKGSDPPRLKGAIFKCCGLHIE